MKMLWYLQIFLVGFCLSQEYNLPHNKMSRHETSTVQENAGQQQEFFRSEDSLIHSVNEDSESLDSRNLAVKGVSGNNDSLRKSLELLVGKWRGEGWMMGPDGEKVQFIQNQLVERKLDGLVYTIDGVGIEEKSIRTDPRVTNQDFIVIYRNWTTGQIEVFIFKQDRLFVSELEFLAEGLFRWAIDLPEKGTSRYTVRINENGQWFQTGEYSENGKSWIQNFRMALRKIL